MYIIKLIKINFQNNGTVIKNNSSVINQNKF